jgi:hypothetical protein
MRTLLLLLLLVETRTLLLLALFGSPVSIAISTVGCLGRHAREGMGGRLILI